MPGVGADHHPGSVADGSDRILPAPPVDGHVFAEDHLVPYPDEGAFTLEGKILGIPAEDDLLGEPAPFTQQDMLQDPDVTFQPGPLADLHVRTYDAKGPIQTPGAILASLETIDVG